MAVRRCLIKGARGVLGGEAGRLALTSPGGPDCVTNSTVTGLGMQHCDKRF